MRKPQTSSEIRRAFLNFFHERGHEVVHSSSLVPAGDTTLLFTNAGMNQFADALLGLEKRPNNRAVSAQKCMRVSGKHNDLEEVGPSDRHQTFFEMLGNFSFGDYFKREAIEYAWTFLTEVLQLPRERLWVTIYTEDDEAAELWKEHISPERILRFGKEENFWEMGDTGPCGPNSEIFYYFGPLEQQDGANGVNVTDQYVEIWNLVFMQYDRTGDGTLSPLPNQSIDTGMGLERICQVVQDVRSNYDTDLFLPILDRTQELLGDSAEQRAEKWIGYRVIADHTRAATFLISDGVLPGNAGRSYVLRLILRRALRFGKKIGFQGPFIAEIAQTVIDVMGDHYHELRERKDFILDVLRKEEQTFQRTLDRGMALLDELIKEHQTKGEKVLPGSEIFRLYDTFGFPYELTRVIAEESGFTIDREGFDQAMAEQRSRARAASTFDVDSWAENYRRLADRLPASHFVGYDYSRLTALPVQIAAIVDPEKGTLLEEAEEGSNVDLLLDPTPFYAEGGGQVADTGLVETEYGRALVEDVQRPIPQLQVHRVTVTQGTLRQGEGARATVDVERRWDIMRNHSATHLLHQALREILGEHAQQRGSLVAPDYLRFDFNHLERLSEAELERIEREVNRRIREDYCIVADEMSLSQAQERGATMLFGEKYGEQVRTITIGEEAEQRVVPQPYSMELCGGTHLLRTGQIGSFTITGEQSVSQGVRRITAVTGNEAERLHREQRRLLQSLAQRVGAQRPEQLEQRIESLQQELDERDRQLLALQRELSRGQLDHLLDEVEEIEGVKVLAARVEASNVENLREMSDWLRDKLGTAFVVLGAEIDGKPLLVAAATEDVVQRGGHAGNLVREVARAVGGGGGGRPNLAQAGGRDASKLPDALTTVPSLVREQLD